MPHAWLMVPMKVTYEGVSFVQWYCHETQRQITTHRSQPHSALRLTFCRWNISRHSCGGSVRPFCESAPLTQVLKLDSFMVRHGPSGTSRGFYAHPKRFCPYLPIAAIIGIDRQPQHRFHHEPDFFRHRPSLNQLM